MRSLLQAIEYWIRAAYKGVRRYPNFLLPAIHLVAMSLSTLIAAVDITSIITTGWICSCTGMVAAWHYLRDSKWLAFLACASTIVIAIVLVVLESIFLHLGPIRAAPPFSLVFLVNQSTTSMVLLYNIHADISGTTTSSSTFTIRSIMFVMVITAIACAVTKAGPSDGYLVSIFLAGVLFLLTLFGLYVCVLRWRMRIPKTVP